MPYSIDILLDNKACEVNGPYHYVNYSKLDETEDSDANYRLNGFSLLKKEMIAGVGLDYVELPFWKIDPKIKNDGTLKVYLKETMGK